MRRSDLLLLAFLIFAADPISGQVPPDAGAVTRASTQIQSPAAPDSTVVALRAQLVLMERYDQRLLATVYWSLGGVVTIAVLLIGFGWFANNRVYERDRAALSQEVSGTIDHRMSEIERNISDSFASIREELQQISQSVVTAETSRITAQLQSVSHAVDDLRYEFEREEANRWTAQGVYANALMSGSRMLEIAVASLGNFAIAEALEVMRAALKNGAEPDAQDAGDIHRVLENLPAEFAADVQNLKEALKHRRA